MSNLAVSSQSVVASSGVLSSGVVSADHLTPDALFIYMQTRLDDIDKQANTAFSKQQKIGAIHEQLDRITNAYAKLDKDQGGALTQADIIEVESALKELEALDPGLAAKVREGLKWDESAQSQRPATAEEAVLFGVEEGDMITELGVSKETLAGAQTTVGNVTKQLESSAQLEMIQLQSVMSARQTAIQLCTNLVSALGKSNEAIVGNIGH
jgi:hypothetical protein